MFSISKLSFIKISFFLCSEMITTDRNTSMVTLYYDGSERLCENGALERGQETDERVGSSQAYY